MPPPPMTPDDEAARDDELIASLRRAVRVHDAAPASLADDTRGLFSWRHPDAELATLVADSREMAGAVRGDETVLLRFVAGGTAVTIELGPDASAGYRMVGQIEPGAPGAVDIRRMDGSRRVVCDDLGRFQADDLSRGPLSLRWIPAAGDGNPVDTPWLLL